MYAFTTTKSGSSDKQGCMITSGSQESKVDKAKKQEQYKRELQQQMQEQANIKKRYLALLLD